MDEMAAKELEQLRQLEQFRKQALVILKNHIVLLVMAFVLFVCGILTLAYLRVKFSSTRYVARISMHYYPKQPGKIRPYDERFLLQLFNRPALRAKFVKALNSKEFGNERPTGGIRAHVEKKKNSSFAIVLYARTEAEAVEFTNAFARLCLQEYATKRTSDLKQWEEVLKQKKKDVFGRIQKINEAKAKLTEPLHVVSPEKDFDRLRLGISDHHAAAAKLSFVVANLKSRQKLLQDDLKQLNPMLLEQKQAIKEQTAEMKRLDREISIAQELYTEENPKLMSLLSRRRIMQTKFEEFLKACGLTLSDTMSLETAEKMHAELKNVQTELENKEEELRVLNNEIAASQKTFDTLTRILPRYRELNQQSASLQDSLQKLDESLADINYLLVLLKDDLFITEKAVAAVGQKPFRKKNLAIAVFAAVALTGFTAVLLILLDLLFGNVAAESEMELREELHYLGKLPPSQSMFSSDVVRDLTFNAVCHHMQSALGNGHVVLAGAMPGAKILPEFFPAVEWNYAMSGSRFLLVDIVLAGNVTEDLPTSDDTGIIAYSGSKGYLPLGSKKYIDPSELELLRQDLTILQKNYDIIVFRHSFAFRHDRLFLEQFIPVCDALLVAVGLGKTSRKSLRELSSLQKSTGLTIMTILSDQIAKHFAKIDMRRES